MYSFSSARAFSLIEILIALAIGTGIALIVFVSFSSFNKTTAVNASTEMILSALEEARSKTLASQQGDVYGVHFDTNSITIFRGSIYDVLDPENEKKAVLPSVVIDSPVLSGGGSDIVFDRLTGKTSSYGTVTLTLGGASTTRTVIIEQTGIAHE